ncbi:MAG: DUF389 domain-containing protein [Hyphomonadaceae bacterium]
MSETPEEPKAQAPNGGLLGRARVLIRWTRRILFQTLPAAEARAVRASVEAEGAFTERFALLCGLSAGIATLGLLQSSAAVVIGAMLISPLMGPIAALGFGFASLDGRRIQKAAQVVGAGALIGVGVGIALTGLSPIRNATPEIIARTAPTLLDLAVAILSGLAGGYATVHSKGETAIGVAIATALMPPLATLGYSIAVLRFDFALGALLLFLTNLAAIAFSFALVARMRGVARPIRNVEFKPQYVVLGLLAFLVLATPLALTLRRITRESFVASTVRHEVAQQLNIDASQIAQLDVSCPFLERTSISVTAVTPAYQSAAEERLVSRLSDILGREPSFALRQIVAADTRAQTQAMIDAALARERESALGNPGIEALRAASRIPITAAWADQSTGEVILAAASLNTLGLAEYHAEEIRLGEQFPAERIQVTPPFQQQLYAVPDAEGDVALSHVVWALQRWRVQRVEIVGLDGRSPDSARALQRAEMVSEALRAAGIETTFVAGDRAAGTAAMAACGEPCARGALITVRAPD